MWSCTHHQCLHFPGPSPRVHEVSRVAPVDVQQHKGLADALELELHLRWEGVGDQLCRRAGAGKSAGHVGPGIVDEEGVGLGVDDLCAAAGLAQRPRRRKPLKAFPVW